VGFVTSGGFAHYSNKSVALGFIPSALIETGGIFKIEILGEKHRAELIAEPLFDPKGQRMRA
jgi:dimethylglycine dehydrogenase